MSTTIDLATQVYCADATALSGGAIVAVLDPPGLAGSVILKVPKFGPRGTGTIHVTGTFTAANFGLFSARSPDADGWDNSVQYTLFDPSGVSGVPAAQVAHFPFGTGLEQYDDAVAAGELYVVLNPGNLWHAITAVSFDYVEPGQTAPPLRQYPRSDGLGASSVRRLWPPPPSVQASNRRAGGYL